MLHSKVLWALRVQRANPWRRTTREGFSIYLSAISSLWDQTIYVLGNFRFKSRCIRKAVNLKKTSQECWQLSTVDDFWAELAHSDKYPGLCASCSYIYLNKSLLHGEYLRNVVRIQACHVQEEFYIWRIFTQAVAVESQTNLSIKISLHSHFETLKLRDIFSTNLPAILVSVLRGLFVSGIWASVPDIHKVYWWPRWHKASAGDWQRFPYFEAYQIKGFSMIDR